MTHSPLDGAPLDGPRVEPSSGTTKSLVILLHGYGANGDDLIELGSQWAPVLPDTAFVAPHAPESCPIAPGGLQWFPLTHNPGGFRSPEEYWDGVRHSEAALQGFIDKELEKHGLNETSCVLVGFSQGTMMALHVGLRRNVQLAGIIGYSGVLAGADKLGDTCTVKPPVLLVHGQDDPVVPVEALPLAREALREVGIEAEWHIAHRLGHSIDPLGFQLGANFLMQKLS